MRKELNINQRNLLFLALIDSRERKQFEKYYRLLTRSFGDDFVYNGHACSKASSIFFRKRGENKIFLSNMKGEIKEFKNITEAARELHVGDKLARKALNEGSAVKGWFVDEIIN